MDIKFVKNVMDKLLLGEDEVLIKLREQYNHSIICSEEYSPYGFYVNFDVYKKDAVIDNKQYYSTFQIGDVMGNVDDITGAVGFVLFVKDGYLQMLEGYTNLLDEWPEDCSLIRLSYYSGEKRDYTKLREKWVISGGADEIGK
ncbi:MAG: hypothetical protein IJZ00_00475 [Lachnospiraceae bacterium]|nr:hypothetical protein [Lachnospiraceae bacterium]